LGKDVLAAMRQSCDKYGVKLALYFSLGDWTWLDMKNPDLQRDQLKELCTEYGPIEYFWMDVAQGDGGRTHQEIVAQVKAFNPSVSSGSTAANGRCHPVRTASPTFR